MNPSKFFERLYVTNEPFCNIVITNKDFVDWALEHNTHNRKISKPTVDAYRRDMEAGNWRLIPNGIGFTKDGVLIDGQHRLVANKEAGYPPVQMVVVGGLELDAQKTIDQHKKRNFAAVCSLAFGVALSSGKSGAVRLLSMFERRRVTNPDEMKICFSERPTMQELSDIMEMYMPMMDMVQDGTRGMSAGFWAVCLYSLKHGANANLVAEFVNKCKLGNGLTQREPARRWRRIFIEGDWPSDAKRGSRSPQTVSIQYTAILLFKHLGIDHLKIDSSNSAHPNTETTNTNTPTP